MANNESKGFYKLSWAQRIGFGAGDMAQNLIYQTISIWLLFFYTNVFGLDPGAAALMFLIVRLVDVLWDPIVGTIVDKGNPKWGKYRSWLVLGGIPLVGLAILCFYNGFSGSLVYAYITYVGMSMCYTLVNVPYGALNASLTRDTNEITILTSTRMFMANLGALCVKSLPLIIALFAPKVLNPETGKMTAVYNTPDAAHAWFITMTIFALAGLALLIFCFFQCKERVVMDEKESANVKVSDLWMEFGRNKPLRVVAFFFITAFAMADAYFMTFNVGATPLLTTLFMWLGTIPAFIFMPLVPAIKRKIGKKGMFYLFLGVAIVGMILMYTFVSIPATKSNFVLLCIAQFVKSTGIITAVGPRPGGHRLRRIHHRQAHRRHRERPHRHLLQGRHGPRRRRPGPRPRLGGLQRRRHHADPARPAGHPLARVRDPRHPPAPRHLDHLQVRPLRREDGRNQQGNRSKTPR